MLQLLLLGLGSVLLLTSLLTTLISKSTRIAQLNRLSRKQKTYIKPAHAVYSKKQGLPPNDPLPYKDVFPPSKREALADCKVDGMDTRAMSELQPDYSKALSDKQVIRPDSRGVTATGYTVQEIAALGHFPDYATLSGVPLPSAYVDFDISKAMPRPYRPFRWAYHQTMSLTKMESDWWLELEKTYASRIAQRQELFKKHGSEVLQALPGSEIATKELMEMCLQFLCARYPHYFRLDLEQRVFHNDILHTMSDLKIEEPLHVILNNIPEDFACMIREPETGLYTFRAGVICSSLGWTVGTKIGLKLHEIHAPIPDYKEKMQFSMDRYFAKKPTDKPIQRGSWGLEIDEPLYMPPGDPHADLRDQQDPAHTLDRCRLRVDWQTLRRLPLSGSVVFNFKAIFTPVTEFRDEPFIPSLMIKLLQESKRSLMEYKSTWHTEHVVIPAMRQYEQEQIAKGLIPSHWDAHTLEESPYFPGWAQKWHSQQGY